MVPWPSNDSLNTQVLMVTNFGPFWQACDLLTRLVKFAIKFRVWANSKMGPWPSNDSLITHVLMVTKNGDGRGVP